MNNNASALVRFLHTEAASGVILLVTAVAALLWANSPAAHAYHALWHYPLAIGFGSSAIQSRCISGSTMH